MTIDSRIFNLCTANLLPTIHTLCMTTQEKQTTLFIGVDVHKDTHTAVALSPFGEQLGEMTITNKRSDFKELVRKMEKIGKQEGLSLRFGLEDCTNYGTHLAEHLSEVGYTVTQVAPVLVSGQRGNATHPEKSDSLDARGVAKVMTEMVDTLPIYTITEMSKKARQIREVSVERSLLVQEKTRVKNQLHRLLHRVWSNYAEWYSDPFNQKALRYYSRSRPSSDPYLVAHMKRKVRRLQTLNKETEELETILQNLVENSNLLDIPGCGVVLAATILGEVGDIRNFHAPGALAKYAGCVPQEYSLRQDHPSPEDKEW